MDDRRCSWMLSLMEPRPQKPSLDGTFFGTNMAIRRNVLFDTGGFNPEAFGERWIGDGEAGLIQKLRARGALIGSVPEAVVFHHIPARRMTPAYLCARMVKEAACTEYAWVHRSGLGATSVLSRLARIGASVARALLTELVSGLGSGDGLAPVRARMGWAYGGARLTYIIRLLVDPEFRRQVLAREPLL
jgi:hypothetical protein